jgi:hypothetical protein
MLRHSRSLNGKQIPKTKDIGQLPYDHPIINFLADLTHRIRCFGKYIFGLANSPQKTSSCTMVDAYRLKHNFGYWLMSYHSESFKKFEGEVESSSGRSTISILIMSTGMTGVL